MAVREVFFHVSISEDLIFLYHLEFLHLIPSYKSFTSSFNAHKYLLSKAQL